MRSLKSLIGQGLHNLTKEYATPPKAPSPPKGEVGIYDSTIYTAADFEQWNPDSLMLNKGMGVYPKMMSDDQCKAVIQFKINAIASRDWYFDVDTDDPDSQAMADFFTVVIKNIRGSFRDAMHGILSALPYGFSITEQVLAAFDYEGKPMWGIEALKVRPFETFTFKLDPHGNVIEYQQRVGGKVIPIPAQKLIHFVHQPDVNEVWGQSDLFACYRDWWGKDNIIKFRNIHLERHASGMTWITIPAGATEQQVSDLKSFVGNMHTKTGGVLPENFNVEQTMPVRTDAYEKGIAQCDKAIAKCVLVPNLLGLSEQGNTGSFAQSQTQFEAFLWILDGIASRLEEALNEQVFRPLARYNFGSDVFPDFRFADMSPQARNELLKVWGDLAEKGSVTKTDADEQHIRKLLEFPEKIEDEVDGTASNKETAFDGVQVTAMQGIVSAVYGKTMPRESAVGILTASYPLTLEQAEQIIGPGPEDDEDTGGAPSPEPDADGLPPGADGDDKPSDGDIGDEPEDDEDKPAEGEVDEKAMAEADNVWSTKHLADCAEGNKAFIALLTEDRQASVHQLFAENDALKKVNFTAQDREHNKSTEMMATELNELMANARAAIYKQTSRLFGTKSGVNIDPEKTGMVSIPTPILSKMRKTTRVALDRAMVSEVKLAQQEIPPSKRKRTFADNLMQTESFLSAQSFKITGALNADTNKAVQNVLSNSIAFDWTLKETINALAEDAKLTSFMPDFEVVTIKGKEVIRAVNKAAVLETIARTSTTTAFNQARESYFNTEVFEGYIQAMQYSAVMDGSTTEICSGLDDKIKRVWKNFIPPNHFNCRSLLVPVTVPDKWNGKESVIPGSLVPNEGFG